MKNIALRWTKRLLLLLLVLLLLALLLLLGYAWRATPTQQGGLKAAGLQAPVQIERDADGVPTLKAQSLADLGYAQGFTHAQDRGWQLEQQRRVVHGRLAELLGPAALETDRFLRVLGVRRAASQQWAWLQTQPDKAEVVALLKAYAAGVNAGWRAQARPPEMLILGAEFEEWTPVDSLGWTLMMSWDLSTNWNTELLRLRLALQLPGAAQGERLRRIHALLPPYPGDAPAATADFPALYAQLGLGTAAVDAQLERLQAAAPLSGVEGTGSNNWALAGARSRSGAPLLANDPHLGLKAPALWYLVRLRAPGLEVAGASLPGLPGLALGQNAHLAWAFTNTGPDTQDLYLEELRDTPDGGTEIRTPQGWQRAQVLSETLKVKGGASETLQIRIGRHGPLISDAGPGRELLAAQSGKRYALALQWMALRPEVDAVGTFLAMSRAANWAEFREVLRQYHGPMQTMLVAEKTGGIHLIAPGRVPVRGPLHDLRGLAPAPGWDARYDWQGEIPFEQLPQRSNPPEGWLASANQKIVGPDYAPHLSHEWAAPWRQQRIEALLAQKDQHGLDDLAAQQADQFSLGVAPLLPAFHAAQASHPLAAKVQALTKDFRGQMDANAAAPAVFWAWTRHLIEAVVADEMGPALAERAMATRSFRDALDGMLAGPHAQWCDDIRTAQTESCAEQADAALTRALEELEQRLGPDPAQWRWGELHLSKAEHTPFSRVAALRPFFELRTPMGGDPHTLNAARVRLRPDSAGQRYTSDHGPSYRGLYDLGDPRRSRVMISTGQSGLPWHPQYRDLFPRWARGESLPLWPEGAPAKTLELQP